MYRPSIRFRPPRVTDAAPTHELISRCEPLDLNSTYAYLLFCTHFSETSAVADVEGRPLGFVAGYLKPADPSVLFIWQIAVTPEARGHGIGAGLLREVLERPNCRDVQYVEATVTPSNEPSRMLFHSLARARRVPCEESLLFRAQDFGGRHHEEEQLLRIGPIQGSGDAA